MHIIDPQFYIETAELHLSTPRLDKVKTYYVSSNDMGINEKTEGLIH